VLDEPAQLLPEAPCEPGLGRGIRGQGVPVTLGLSPGAAHVGPPRRGRSAKHPRYGYGVILGEEGSGEETRLTVYFDRAGKKKFVAATRT